MSNQRKRMAAAYAALDELYDQLPRVRCKGLCADSCTVVPASELEQRRIAERGYELITRRPPGPIPRCPALGPLDNCMAYDVRPFVCRAFGSVVDPRADPSQWRHQPLMCDYGCEPEADQYITVAESRRISDAIERFSREVTGVPGLPLPEDAGRSGPRPNQV